MCALFCEVTCNYPCDSLWRFSLFQARLAGRQLFNQPVEVALAQAILRDGVFIKFALGKTPGDFSADPARMFQYLLFVELQAPRRVEWLVPKWNKPLLVQLDGFKNIFEVFVAIKRRYQY